MGLPDTIGVPSSTPVLVPKLVAAARFPVLAALMTCGLLMSTLAILVSFRIPMQLYRTSWPAKVSVVDTLSEIIANMGTKSFRELSRWSHRAPQRFFCVSGVFVSLRAIFLTFLVLITFKTDTNGAHSSTPVLVPKLVEAARFLALAAPRACSHFLRALAILRFFGTHMQPHRTSWPARESVVASTIGAITRIISMLSQRTVYFYLFVVFYLNGCASRIASLVTSPPIGMAPIGEQF
jgi:hypothetical protein